MKRLFTFIFILIGTVTMAQIQLFHGKSSYSGDILYNFDGSYIYRGKSTYSGDILYSWDGKYVYKGKSTYSGDILYTYNGILPVPMLVMMMK